MVSVTQVQQEIKECDPERVELAPHVFQRARKRNVDPSELRDKIKQGKFEEVRENKQSDTKFEYSYKVKVESNGMVVEVPLYFNIPGPRILVKSIWPGE